MNAWRRDCPYYLTLLAVFYAVPLLFTAWAYILVFGGTALLGNAAAALLTGRRR